MNTRTGSIVIISSSFWIKIVIIIISVVCIGSVEQYKSKYKMLVYCRSCGIHKGLPFWAKVSLRQKSYIREVYRCEVIYGKYTRVKLYTGSTPEWSYIHLREVYRCEVIFGKYTGVKLYGKYTGMKLYTGSIPVWSYIREVYPCEVIYGKYTRVKLYTGNNYAT